VDAGPGLWTFCSHATRHIDAVDVRIDRLGGAVKLLGPTKDNQPGQGETDRKTDSGLDKIRNDGETHNFAHEKPQNSGVSSRQLISAKEF